VKTLRWSLLLFVVAAGLRASDSLGEARRARSLLGPGVWSEVIEVDNRAGVGRYPADVYALVFEFEHILWFYTDTDGTQSLSQYAGRTDRDKADLGPLIKAVDPGFGAWKVVPESPGAAAAPPAGRLKNGCVIESIALLRRRIMLGAAVADPKLLFYYVRTPAGLHGHTVLAFDSGKTFTVIDPEFPRAPWSIPRSRAGSPVALAGAMRGDIAKARWLPIDINDLRPQALKTG
jgi:hypothetical protein